MRKNIKNKNRNLKRQIRIFTTYLLILGLSGAYVYADDPETSNTSDVVSEDSSETGEDSSENTSEKTSEKDSENTGDQTEGSTEKKTEKTEKKTQESTEKKTEKTEKQTQKSTEKKTEKTEELTQASTEDQTGSTETASSDGPVTSDTQQAATVTALPYTAYLDSARVANLRTKYAEDIMASQEVRTLLNNMKRNQNSFIENLQQMDEEIISLQTRMDEMEADRQMVDATLLQLETELELAQQDVDMQYQKLKEHIQNSYENGNYSYLDALLYAADFADILNRTEYVQQVSLYDSVLLVRYQTARQSLANRMAMLKVMTDDYGVMQTYYQDQQEALVLLSNEKEKEILAFQAQIDEQQTELTKLQLQMQQDANEIARLEAEAQAKALEARLKQLQDQTGVVIPASISRDPIITPITPYNGEIFVWPQPSSTRITSDYGWRGDIGIPGASKDHKGIDIAANMYDPVVAAASGTVIFVGYDGSGGNTVKIDIGQDLVIIYHHLSRYAVVKGDTVNAGQVVGYAGSTGVSSAPHLHFSVKLNGQYVNPRPYLGLPY